MIFVLTCGVCLCWKIPKFYMLCAMKFRFYFPKMSFYQGRNSGKQCYPIVNVTLSTKLLWNLISKWKNFLEKNLFKEMHLAVSFVNCLGLNVLTHWGRVICVSELTTDLPTFHFRNAEWFWNATPKMLNIKWNDKEFSKILLNLPDLFCLY